MNTGQKYGPLRSGATSFVPTVITVDEFITQNSDLFGLYPADVAARLSERLQLTPVKYATVLDGIALLRAFTPRPPAYHPSHYALLLNGFCVTGFVWIPTHAADDICILSYPKEIRWLTGQILAGDANKLLIGSTRVHTDPEADYCPFDKSDLFEITSLVDAFDTLGVELMDYLLLLPDHNESYYLHTLEEEYSDEGITADDITFHYTGFTGVNSPSAPAY